MELVNPIVGLSPGVLAKKQLEQLVNDGAITSAKYGTPKIGASAFDLRLGSSAWKITLAQRPATRELAKLKAESNALPLVADGEFFLFERKGIYLVELDHYLKLPANVNGRATGKSSIGRLDVITRLLTDNSSEYDTVEAGYTGPLHLLIQPQTFPIKVKPGQSLNQLRLYSGPPHASVITRWLIPSFDTPFWYVPYQERKQDYKCWSELLLEYNKSPIADPSLFDLTVELSDQKPGYIFKAKELAANIDAIDLRKGEKSHDPTIYFETVDIQTEGAARWVDLKANSFYIMKSKERLFIPHDVAVEVIAISERIGDIRIHYAGFAHPGFGRHNDPEKRGTPLIFEVRATDMDTRLYDGSLLARIQLFRMSAETTIESSAYDKQELKLSSYFADWPGNHPVHNDSV
jgi:dCTP deaminase